MHLPHPARWMATMAALAAAHAPALAADATFTDETSFRAAAGAVAMESFEGVAGRVRGLTPIVAGALTIATDQAPIGVQTAADAPEAGFGAAATDGLHWVSVYLAGQSQGSITLSFGSATTAFGVKIIDVGEIAGSVTLSTDTGAFAGGATLLSFPPTVNSGTVRFIGLTQDTAFSRVTLNVSGVDDAYGLDQVLTSAVPEPATALTLLLGLGGVGMAARRRRR